MTRARPWRARAAWASAALLGIGAACGPRLVRETVFEERGVRVVLRSEDRDGRAVERGFGHPATVAGVRAANVLSHIQIRPDGNAERAREPAIRSEILYALGEGISQGLARATPDQEIVATALRRERRFGLFTREYLTGLVAWVEGERLHVHLTHLDWPVPRGDDERLPEPWPDKAGSKFRVLPGEALETTGPHSVAVRWRDARFRSAGSLRVAPGGKVLRRTILLESPEAGSEEPAVSSGSPPTQDALSPETLRGLADLEEARRRGEISEAEYQARRRNLLAGDSAAP